MKKLTAALFMAVILLMFSMPAISLDIPEPISLAIWGAAYSPDGKIIALASSDGNIHLFDAETGKLKVESSQTK